MTEKTNEMVDRGLSGKCLLRLLPRHHVYLFSPEDGGKRFVQLFRSTWRRVPYGVRRRILGHWKSGGHHLNFRPTIELIGGWAGRIEGERLGGVKAAAGGGGHLLRFWVDIVRAYPDDLVMDLIAHELVHVYGYACGWYREEFDDPFQVEADADAKMEEWGFSSTAMDDWDLDNDVGVPDFTKMDEAEKARWAERQHASHLRRGR